MFERAVCQMFPALLARDPKQVATDLCKKSHKQAEAGERSQGDCYIEASVCVAPSGLLGLGYRSRDDRVTPEACAFQPPTPAMLASSSDGWLRVSVVRF
jgi:hypothetical protein